MKRLISILAIFTTIAISSFARPDEDCDMITDRLSMVEGVDPTTAFLMLETLNSQERDALVSDLLSYADSFLGRPYCRGARGPKSFDCSGFTSFVFSNFGISLSSSSSTQYTQGNSIERDEIMPGDLLFFSGRGAGSRVGHVAIAVDVDEDGTITFIHAATSGGIRYDSFPDGGYYSKRYIGARRVID